MCRKGLIVVALLLLCAWRAVAYDFAVPVQGGNTLYFSYADGGVAVVHPNTSTSPAAGWNGYPRPVGALTIPATVEHDGVSYNVVMVALYAFYNCDAITSVTVPEGVEALYGSAFRGCSALAAVALPSTIDTISDYVFYGCDALQSVAIQCVAPPHCSARAFYELPLDGATLTVPNGSTEAYGNRAPWSAFGTIAEAVYEATLTAEPNYVGRGSVEGGGTYTVGAVATLTATPAEGFFFACWGDGDTLNPRVVTVEENRSLAALFFAMQYDTAFVTVHDSVVVHDTVNTVTVQVDTVVVRDTVTMVAVHVDTVVVHDTVTVTLTEVDTVYIIDTVAPTFFRLTVAAEGGGVGIGNGLLPAGTVAEIGALPTEGCRFMRWDDGGTDNPRTVTLTGNMTFTALFETLGVEVVDMGLPWTADVEGGDIVVRGASGHRLRLFSADGRQLYSGTVEGDAVRFRCAAGVYLLSVDGGAARKIVTTEH